MSDYTQKLTLPESQIAGRRVRQMREARDWIQRDLAAKAGLSQGTVSLAERGEARLPVRVAARLAAALGTDLETLAAPCGRCAGRPAAGFKCMLCGAEAAP